MNHPFEWLPWSGSRWLFFALSITAAIVFAVYPGRLGKRLSKTPNPPRGMISFQFAGTVERATRIVASWTPAVRQDALRILLWDYGFIFFYVLNMTYLCVLAGHTFHARHWTMWQTAALGLAWGQLAAGFFDCVENGCLLQILARLDSGGAISQPWPLVAAIAAGLKFFFLGCGLLCTLVAIVAYFRN